MGIKYKGIFGPITERCYEWVGMVIFSILVAIAAAVLVIVSSDLTPATPKDYNELYSRLLSVEGNKEDFFNGTGTIRILEDKIIYEIENDECKMTGDFNKDLELINYSQSDKKVSLALLIIVTIFIAVFAFYLALLVSFGVVFGIELIICIIIKIINNHRKKNFIEHGFGE